MGRDVADWEILVGRAASAITQRRGSNDSALEQEAIESIAGTDGLLFLGNPHETVPRALLLDRRLGAVDVLGWQMIRLLANADRTTAFPTYDELQPLLRSGIDSQASRGTVARVMAVLRLTRWMSLAHRARNETNGRVIGNVYVLHDEPVSPMEASLLDREYYQFVLQSCRHKNRMVREVAMAVCTELEVDGDLPREPNASEAQPSEAPLARLNRRAGRFEELQADPATPSSPGELSQFSPESSQFPTRTQPRNNDLGPSSPRELRQFDTRAPLSSRGELSKKSSAYRLVREANSVPTVVRSSLNTTSTGYTPTDRDASDLFWSDLLEFSSDERTSLRQTLSVLPNGLQQAVLDETAGRVAAGKSDNPRGLLHALIKRSREGEFRATRFAQDQAARRGERYVLDKPRSQGHSPIPDLPQGKPVSQKGSFGNEPAEPHVDGQAARRELLASLGIKR